MKKAVGITLAISSALLAGSVSAATVYKDDSTTLDVYGHVKGAHTFNQKQGKNGKDASEVRIGVKGSQALNPNFALTGQYEGNYSIYHQRYINRKAWAGIDAKEYGAVTVGRQDGLLYNVNAFTDMAPELPSGWSASPDAGLLGRADSVIQYQVKNSGVTATAQYKLESTRSLENRASVEEGAAYGLSVTGENIADSGAFAGAAFANQKSLRANVGDSHTYSIGGGWTDGKTYVAATSAFGKNTHTGGKSIVRSFYDNELITQYKLDNGVTPSLGYVDSNADGSHVKYVETGASYAFNKNVSADVDFAWDTTGSKNNLVKTGIKYKF